MCNWKTSKGKFCKRKPTENTNYCVMHGKKILKEIKEAQIVSEEKSKYARDLYGIYMRSI